MATTKTRSSKKSQPAQAKTAEATTTPQGTRPVDLAKDLGINAKSLRAYLRRAYPRDKETFGTTWYLNKDQVEAARKNFKEKAETPKAEA